MNESPRALIVTVYGLYARETGGWMSIAALIRILGELGVDEPAVRSAMSRLKRRGLLEPRRHDGSAGYALTEAAAHLLREGDERIFHPRRGQVSDGWVLVVFSVPETERQRRHTLRSQLTRLGFGTAAPGVWVAPAHRYAIVRDTLDRLDLSQYVTLFVGETPGIVDIEAWWDLPELRTLYEEFLAAYSAVTGENALADWVRALTAWRRLPYLDPGLPHELLPADWPGTAAHDLLHTLERKLAGPAHDRVAELLS
ncbi:PaaX family transcriptional regulator [Longispora albida]|uniref:PaaX family transcriptional regulator n=1 Tax=Longispora albida TaxID=203523 RepID=UPI0003808613|nr:PaaX family transcriptional regulator C-terminal domain-containing protein [Longispora albida]